MEHVPVLLQETLRFLRPAGGGVFVDCTLGLGGHAEALLEADERVRLVGIDRDPEAIRRAGARLERFGPRVRIVQGRNEELAERLREVGEERVTGILADLGVSSLQLDTPERGFSFRFEGPLDMRMGSSELTAQEIVNRYSEAELEQIFREHGEERRARGIARAIARQRQRKPIETTVELREIVGRAQRRGRRPWAQRIDPATRVFQALRIEVNAELSGLERLIDEAVRLLEGDGRLVVISYHSLEDRIVKNRLRDLARGEVDEITGRPRSETRVIELMTRKPVRPSEDEVAINPRSRSARLRAARRLSLR